MRKHSFSEGIEVYYQTFSGKIIFICDRYLTVCIREFNEKVRNVNLLIYYDSWKDIKLKKESEK